MCICEEQTSVAEILALQGENQEKERGERERRREANYIKSTVMCGRGLWWAAVDQADSRLCGGLDVG